MCNTRIMIIYCHKNSYLFKQHAKQIMQLIQHNIALFDKLEGHLGPTQLSMIIFRFRYTI